jgi:hypothetical protein
MLLLAEIKQTQSDIIYININIIVIILVMLRALLKAYALRIYSYDESNKCFT